MFHSNDILWINWLGVILKYKWQTAKVWILSIFALKGVYHSQQQSATTGTNIWATHLLWYLQLLDKLFVCFHIFW